MSREARPKQLHLADSTLSVSAPGRDDQKTAACQAVDRLIAGGGSGNQPRSPMFSAALRLVVPFPAPRLRARRRVGGLAARGPLREVRAEVSSQATALLPTATDTRRLDDEALR